MFDPRRASQGDETRAKSPAELQNPLAGRLALPQEVISLWTCQENVTQRQTQAATPHAARCRILFHSIRDSSHFVFPFSSLAPSRRPLRVSASLVPRLLSERLGSHDKGARLLADAQALLVPGNPPTRRKQFRANGNVQYCMLEARGRC